MRLPLLLLAALAAAASPALAGEVDVRPAGDAAATILAVTGQGSAFCGGTWCGAASLDGDGGCYGSFCAAAGEEDASCYGLACGAVAVFGDSNATSRPINRVPNAVLAASAFGDARSDTSQGEFTLDVAVSGTGDASTEDGVALSLTGRASQRRSGLAVGGCDLVAALCLDPA